MKKRYRSGQLPSHHYDSFTFFISTWHLAGEPLRDGGKRGGNLGNGSYSRQKRRTRAETETRLILETRGAVNSKKFGRIKGKNERRRETRRGIWGRCASMVQKWRREELLLLRRNRGNRRKRGRVDRNGRRGGRGEEINETDLWLSRSGNGGRIMEDRKSIKFVGATKSAQLFNFVDYLRSSSFFMSLSRCGIHLWSWVAGKGCVYARMIVHCYKVVSPGASARRSKSDFLSACRHEAPLPFPSFPRDQHARPEFSIPTFRRSKYSKVSKCSKSRIF